MISWLASHPQITDDSSKLVYSSKTTLIIYENDLKNNAPKERHPDTTLYQIENFTELDIEEHKYQNLGNNGTAMYPIFYPVREQIGRTSGLYVYDPMFTFPESFRYYDTKSPHINMEIALGGAGRSVVNVDFTQNVNENWNVGFNIYRITSDKQLGRVGQGDRNVQGTIFDLFTYYKHKKAPYSALFHVIRMNYDVAETGGIFVEDLSSATDAQLFLYQDSDLQLSDASASDQRTNFHLYHQYAWQDQLQFYHQLDVNNQTVGYKDNREGNTVGDYNPYDDFYDDFLLGSDSTYERFDWNEVVNEVGIKGDLANLFYRVYLKRRDLNLEYLYFDPTDKEVENFLGGYTRFDWRDKFNVEARGELLQTGQYRLRGSLNSELIFGSYTSVSAKPAFIYENYFGNHHEWHQNLQSVFSNEITGGIQLNFDFLRVRPTGRLLSLDKFLYFDQNINPRQSNSIAVLSSIGGDFDLRLYTNRAEKEAFHLENEIYFTAISGNGADNLRVPNAFYNGRFFWRGAWFKNTMGVEIGIDIHGKSSYYAMAYAPELQQFYLQDEFLIQNFYTADLFLNMKFNNLRAFAKMTNLNQANNDGYFVTPYYPGQAKVFDLGVRWLFFD